MGFTAYSPTVGNSLVPLSVANGGTGLTTSPITVALGGTGLTTDPVPPSTAADQAFVAWNGDPAMFTGTAILIAGSVYLARINVRAAITATNVNVYVTTGGNNTGGSTGTFVGLYSSAGTLLSGSSDVAASLVTTGALQALALTTSQALTAGTFVWAAIITNLGTTQPTLAKAGVNNTQYSAGLAAATLRGPLNGTGRTTLAASITPASNTNTNAIPIWAALS